MKAITSQRKQLYKLFGYNSDTEAVHVKHITGDQTKVAASDLSMIQANDLINSLTTNWAFFDKNNTQHSNVLSLCHQLGWVQDANPRFVDLQRLSNWFKSFRSPVQKPLQAMEPKEVSKVIFALEQMLGKKYK
jgi:hypothetical protein